jgi:hypothetical protein
MAERRPILSVGGDELEELTQLWRRAIACMDALRVLHQEAFDLTIWCEVQVSLSPWQRVPNSAVLEAAIIAQLQHLYAQAAWLLAEQCLDLATIERILRTQ